MNKKPVFAFFVLLFFQTPVFSQLGNTPGTISMDASTDNSTAFGTEGVVGVDKVTFYTYWDEIYLYLGWSGGNTNSNSDLFYAAIDTDPNGTNGATDAIEGVSFVSAPNTRKPDFYVVYENNSRFFSSPVTKENSFEIFEHASEHWKFMRSTTGNDHLNSRVDFQNSNGEVRLRIPWTVLGFLPGNTTPVGITMWTNNGSGNHLMSRFPIENPDDGPTPRILSHSFIFYNSSIGVNPSTDRVIENNTFTTGSINAGSNMGISITGNVVLNADLFLNSNLNILPNSTLSVNDHRLIIKTITGPGKLTGSPGSSITLAAGGTLNMDQSSPLARSLQNLSVFDNTYVVLKSDLDLYGTLTVGSSASLDFNQQHVTFRSTENGMARFAAIPPSSSLINAENVTVEQYIKPRLHVAGIKGDDTGMPFYLIAPGVNSNGSIRDNWMEGGMNISPGTNDNPAPSYGTQITGPGGNANWFDVSKQNKPSLFSIANGVKPAFSPMENTRDNLNALAGYFIGIRGNRSMKLNLDDTVHVPEGGTILRSTGSLLTGTQSAFANKPEGGGAFNLVANPFVAPLDWKLVKSASKNITPNYTFWDPAIGTSGGFVTADADGNSSAGTGGRFIPMGRAFFVESDGGVPEVIIEESHKAPGNYEKLSSIAPAGSSMFRIKLYFTDEGGNRRMADGVLALFNSRYRAAVDTADAKEINNREENIAIARDGFHLAIEKRPELSGNDRLPLFINNMKERQYEFEFTPSMSNGAKVKAELVDNFLGKRTPISLTDPTIVVFSITSESGSSAANRFSVEFGPKN